jgi:hypothetical protein
MHDIKPIHTQADHKAALAEIERLWDAVPGTPSSTDSMSSAPWSMPTSVPMSPSCRPTRSRRSCFASSSGAVPARSWSRFSERGRACPKFSTDSEA